jgi:sugar phosphate isomerase/epimerase
MGTVEDVREFAEFLNEKAVAAAQHDMRIGYHSHGFDFRRFDGVTGWELLFGATEKEVIMQLDVGNCAGGGGDPIKMLEKFPGRCSSLHIKEHPGGPLGAGEMDWSHIFDLCETRHDTQWYVVEQVGPEFTMAAQAIDALKEMGKM